MKQSIQKKKNLFVKDTSHPIYSTTKLINDEKREDTHHCDYNKTYLKKWNVEKYIKKQLAVVLVVKKI